MRALQLILFAHSALTEGHSVVVEKREHVIRFSTSDGPFPLGAGLQAWHGFSSSVRTTHKQLMVNVNIQTMPLYMPGNLAERMLSFTHASPSGRPDSFISGIRVKTLHLSRTKKIRGVAKLDAQQFKFETDDFGEVTAEKYFKLSKLRLPSLRLVMTTISRIQYHPSATEFPTRRYRWFS